MKTGIAIFNLLANDADVSALTSNRIFPAVTAKNATMPFVTYDVVTIAPNDTKTGVSKLDDVDVEIVCHAQTYSAASNLATVARAALDRATVTLDAITVDSIQFQTGDVEVVDKPRKFMVVLEFKVRQRMT